jgi:hypothetical protein
VQCLFLAGHHFLATRIHSIEVVDLRSKHCSILFYSYMSPFELWPSRLSTFIHELCFCKWAWQINSTVVLAIFGIEYWMVFQVLFDAWWPVTLTIVNLGASASRAILATWKINFELEHAIYLNMNCLIVWAGTRFVPLSKKHCRSKRLTSYDPSCHFHVCYSMTVTLFLIPYILLDGIMFILKPYPYGSCMIW